MNFFVKTLQEMVEHGVGAEGETLSYFPSSPDNPQFSWKLCNEQTLTLALPRKCCLVDNVSND
jgi:hypothetical protein